MLFKKYIIRYKHILVILLAVIAIVLPSFLWMAEKSVQKESHYSLEGIRLDELSVMEQRELFDSMTNTIDVQLAYNIFVEAFKNMSDRHVSAHIFGEFLFGKYGTEGIGVCDGSFQFGCYHGFLGLAIATDGISDLRLYDDACKKRWGDAYLSCQHGIGHGLVASAYENDTAADNLIDALILCQTISWRPTGGCSGGVFMEYNFRTMDIPDDFLRRSYDETDPYVPCNTLPEEFKPSCYHEQVQWWLSEFDYDHQVALDLCSEIPDALYARECYRGIGSFVPLHVDYDPVSIRDICSATPSGEAKRACLIGAIDTFAEYAPEKNIVILQEEV